MSHRLVTYYGTIASAIVPQKVPNEWHSIIVNAILVAQAITSEHEQHERMNQRVHRSLRMQRCTLVQRRLC